jgi:hypothetical protein
VKNFLLLLATLATPLLGQGSGSIATPPSVSGSDGEPFRVTRSVTGIVQSVDSKSSLVEDSKTRKPLELQMSNAAKVRVTGQGIAKWEDIAVGMRLRINYAQDDRRVLDVRVLAPPPGRPAPAGKDRVSK